MTGEIFWKRVSNASRFLDDAIDELLSGRSVVLTFEDDIPWKDVMLDVLAEKLLPCLNTCSLDPYTAEGVTDPGEFLLRRYFNARDRSNYWPGSGSVEKFMAEQNSTDYSDHGHSGDPQSCVDNFRIRISALCRYGGTRPLSADHFGNDVYRFRKHLRAVLL